MAGLPAHQLKGNGREGSGRAPRATEETDKSLRCARIEGRQLLQGWLDRRVQDPKCAPLKRARPEEVHREERGKRAKGARFAEGQVPPAAPTSEDVKPSRTGLAPGSAKHTRSGPSTLGGLGDMGRVHGGHALLRIISILRRRRNPGPAQADAGPRVEFHSKEQLPGCRRRPRNRPPGHFRKQRAPLRLRQSCVTAGAGRCGAEAEGLRAVWEQEVVLLPKSHKHWPNCSDTWLINRFLLLF